MLKPRRYRITPIGETWAEFLRAQGSRAVVPGELFSLITTHPRFQHTSSCDNLHTLLLVTWNYFPTVPFRPFSHESRGYPPAMSPPNATLKQGEIGKCVYCDKYPET